MVLLLVASVAVNVWQWRSKPEPSVVIERDTVWRDSIIREPVESESKETGETIYVKIPSGEPSGTVTILPGETAGTVTDSALVALPVEQKRYDDSLYTAWVSGYRPALDSIALHIPEVTTTITKTIVTPAPRFAVGPSVGIGYGIINRKPDVFVGVTATWNIWRK